MTFDYSRWAWPCLLREVKAVAQDDYTRDYATGLMSCQVGLGDCPYCNSDTRKLVERLEGRKNPKLVALREELRTRVEGKKISED